jgi:hypothetical protein
MGPSVLEKVIDAALRKANMGLIRFVFVNNVGKVDKGEYCLWLRAGSKDHKK